MRLRTLVILSSSIFVAACASQPDGIRTAYTSPMKYNGYDCPQIVAEMDHMGRRSTDLHMALKKKADGDTAQMAIGMILFWPALFFLEGGDGPEAAEYATLKGDYEALRQTAVAKKCDTALFPPSPQELIKAEIAKEQEAIKASAPK